MAFEVELKAWLQQPVQTETLAGQLGEFKYETLKEDVYFRRKSDTSRVPADRFRLRRTPERAVVTAKQKIRASDTEVNDETEFEVSDAHAFFKFSDRFGFEPFVVKRKKSRVYQVGRAAVEFNDVEHLGHFIEIEILCDTEAEVPFARTELARLYTRLELGPADLERRFYIDMLQAAYPAQYRFVDDPALDWPFEEVLAR